MAEERRVETVGVLPKSIPAGTSYCVHKDGVVSIGSTNIHPEEFLRLIEQVTKDKNFMDAVEGLMGGVGVKQAKKTRSKKAEAEE